LEVLSCLTSTRKTPTMTGFPKPYIICKHHSPNSVVRL
jgi:hypothetical protein